MPKPPGPKSSDGAGARPSSREGEVVAAHGRNFLVECNGGEIIQCLTRRKNAAIACGDRVLTAASGDGVSVIETVCARRSLFLRAAAHREKLIAANATQLALVVATEPSFSDELLMRAITAAECAGLKTLVVLNKSDLADTLDQARERLKSLKNTGYRVIETCALGDLQALAALLQGEKTVLAGQSGMGKSTIINGLFPGQNAATQSISHFLASGRHTTSASRMYRFDAQTSIIDSPGMQEFGLAHLDRATIEASMPDFHPYRGQCRFQNCKHGPEPDCALRIAVEQGHIDKRRFELFHRIVGASSR
ncbi:MAG: ribosome small subunit-dependent GTPase A [Betaproteobacteria bacterium]|nr:ribosome small subunit-dependent GTPase A [Betaproteobacteria bacterium]